MNDADLGEYLVEYQAVGIGSLMYDLILNIVKKAVSPYPAVIYAPSREWDKAAIADVTQEFIIDWLLYSGRLEYRLLASGTTEILRYGIHIEFKKYLANQRRRTEYGNLFTRIKRILVEDGRFGLFGGTTSKMSSTVWGLSENSSQGVIQDIELVITRMFEIELPAPIKYRAESKKLSPLLMTSDLEKLLFETFYKLGKPIEFKVLMDALRYRLNLSEINEVSFEHIIDTEGEITLGEITPESYSVEYQVNAHLIAEDIFEMLSDRQRQIFGLQMYIDNPTSENIAGKIHASKSTVHNELRQIQQRIRDSRLNETEAEELLSILGEMCSEYMRTIGHQRMPDLVDRAEGLDANE